MNSNKLERICYEKIEGLLVKSKLEDAFNLIDHHLTDIDPSSEFTEIFVASSAKFYRTENAYKLGLISWEQYDVQNSQVINITLKLAVSICHYKSIQPEEIIIEPGSKADGFPSKFEELKSKSNKAYNRKRDDIFESKDNVRKILNSNFKRERNKAKQEVKRNLQSLISEMEKLNPI